MTCWRPRQTLWWLACDLFYTREQAPVAVMLQLLLLRNTEYSVLVNIASGRILNPSEGEILMDKTRGFVNGAIGEIVSVFDAAYFTVRLKTGTMILMHPI